MLVRLLLAGSLTPIRVPSAAFEAARDLARAREQVRVDLARAREQVRVDLARARHRVSKLPLRHGCVYERSGGTWAQVHRRWFAGQRFEQAATELAYVDALAAVDGLIARRQALDERLSRLAHEPELWPTVARLRCFRGVETLTALALHLEICDLDALPATGQLAAWLGLVPSLNQSGESQTRGSITKTGSSYARRLLVEAAWHYLPQPRIGATLANRQTGQPAHVLQIAWRAQHRLHRQHRRLPPATSPSSRSHASSPVSSGLPPSPPKRQRRLTLARKAPGPNVSARAIALWAANQPTPAPRRAPAGDASRALG